MKKDGGMLVVYSRHPEGVNEILQNLDNWGVDITLENCDKCLTNLEKCMLDTLEENNPNLVLIENDSTNNGLILYKMIKDEGTLEDIPVMFLGYDNSEGRIHALKLGALDYIEKPYPKDEIVIKIRNFIELDKKFIMHEIYDRMTGVYSRSYGEETAKKVFEILKLEKRNFSVLVLDIDNMSNINNLLGKKTGDSIIKDCADAFRKAIEPRDFIYRYSGARFVAAFPQKDAGSVVELSKGIFKELKELDKKYGITVSCTGGIAADSDTSDFTELLEKAFECMERGKLKEKGRVYLNDVESKQAEKSSLLIINEDKVISGILSSRYRNKGFKTFVSEDIESAEEIIRQHSIDMVLTDYIIPGTTGIEAIKRIKNLNRNVKIIILSAQRNEYVVETALGAGADDYVVKPFSPVELDSRIKRLLE